MNVLSLFDWISCGQVALREAWINVDKFYSSEVDKFAIDVVAHRFPNTIELWDVTKWESWDIDWSSIDLLFAGFPCQAWSVAWRWLWDRDPRGKLMWDMLDILEKIRTENPNVKFLFENVKMKKEFMDYCTSAIGVEPIMINSSLLTAQNRRRMYRTNIEWVRQPEDKWIVLKDILENDVDDKYSVNPDAVKRYIMNGKPKWLVEEDWKSKCLTASCHKWYGNDWVTTIKVTNLAGKKFFDNMRWDDEKSKTLTAWWQNFTNSGSTNIIRVGHLGNGGQGDRIYSPEWKSVTLSANWGGRGAKTGLYWIKQRSRWYNKWETLHTEKSPTLSSHSWEQNNILTRDDIAIRKLTPRECERLQWLPDDYTLTPTGKRMMSDTQRYKQCGNWWTIPVISHILSYLKIDENS